jgi:maltooligosyltrehalose trehalohydrolase
MALLEAPLVRSTASDRSVHAGSTPLGATSAEDGSATFLVWAPFIETCSVHLVAADDRLLEMTPLAGGYFGLHVRDCGTGTRYFYQLNGSVDRPDPASRCQPEGVHGPSMLTSFAPHPRTGWHGIDLRHYVIYELHIGTFTREGTFDAAIAHLDRLSALGVTAIEVMPVAEFPGGRNWGYDGVFPFAVEHRYGSVEGLKRLVHACHERGLAFILDVVYNHLGPEGNYLRDFGPYFTDRHKTPWGDAINFDGPHSDDVRRYFIENALYWIEQCGVDALRLDAVHAIHDESAYPFLQELAATVHACSERWQRPLYLIGESDLNDARLITPAARGGIGLDAQWADDFHHCLHILLTGESCGYYADFGSVEQLAKAMREGWVYTGEYSVLRQRRYGNSPAAVAAHQLVVCSQNHDQVGNRMRGERLLALAGWDAARVAAAAVILSPYIPLLFMGEEYGEPAPFLYHVSHYDPDLQDAVRRGRREEFADFLHQGEPPDPQSEETFQRSKLNQALAESGAHRELQEWYRRLLELRRTHPALRELNKRSTVAEAFEAERTLLVRRLTADVQALVLLHFGTERQDVRVFLPRGEWTKVLDSTGSRSVAHTLSSTGEVVGLTLAPLSVLVLSAEPA